MKLFQKSILLVIITLFISCQKIKNEVLVLGTIHGRHLTEENYNVEKLTQLIKEIKPDIILTEIPPGLFQEAMQGFKKNDTISQPRVMRFPEYTKVI